MMNLPYDALSNTFLINQRFLQLGMSQTVGGDDTSCASFFLLYWNKWEGLTGLQEALQLHGADELLPVVRPAGNDA